MTVIKSLLLVVLAGLCAFWATSLMTMPVVYKSVHDVGYRVGTVLPQGFDPGSQLHQDQALRVTPVTRSDTPSRPPASMRGDAAQAQPMSEGFSHRLWIAALVMGCTTLALGGGVFVRWYNWREEARHEENPEPLRIHLVRASLILLPVGVLMALAFVFARVFWTGVDDAFIARSIMVRPDSASIHVTGDTTLSMTSMQMLMLYIALVLTMVPLMFRLALHGLGTKPINPRTSELGPQRRLFRLPSWAVGRPTGSYELAFVLYLLLTLVMWTSPWSTTVARAMWSL
ncbi:unnamed protein product [Laminaria digitata]